MNPLLRDDSDKRCREAESQAHEPEAVNPSRCFAWVENRRRGAFETRDSIRRLIVVESTDKVAQLIKEGYSNVVGVNLELLESLGHESGDYGGEQSGLRIRLAMVTIPRRIGDPQKQAEHQGRPSNRRPCQRLLLRFLLRTPSTI